jgi:hypothetical protein
MKARGMLYWKQYIRCDTRCHAACLKQLANPRIRWHRPVYWDSEDFILMTYIDGSVEFYSDG